MTSYDKFIESSHTNLMEEQSNCTFIENTTTYITATTQQQTSDTPVIRCVGLKYIYLKSCPLCIRC